jgi:MoaA/NifB/PqqE/SkfB family radical SAM enzyme
MTSENAASLKNFITLAMFLNADGVVAYYNYVYRFDQKKLSCYFIQEEANKAIDEAAEIASDYAKEDGSRPNICLPPKFNQKEYPQQGICREAWSQIMINSRGDIISCDVAGDSNENILEKEFMEVWNGKYYTGLRKMLVEKPNSCSSYCFRANSAAVNDFRGHFITRGRSQQEIAEFMEGA